MATRLKTVKYCVPTYTTLIADAVVTNLPQITLYLPESSKVFKSVTVEWAFQDVITATGGTIGEHRLGLRLGAAAYTTFTELDDITHSGEQLAGMLGPVDFTSHFNTNWSGTSMTCDLQVYFDQTTGTTLGMRNINAEITITYEYDDTSATHVKTVTIPLQSSTADLPTAANSNFGTNQIPQLTGVGGILPEQSVVIRDYYFVIEGNSSNSGTTDYTITANIDSGTSTSLGTVEGGLASGVYLQLIYKPTVPSTTATHNFQLWSSVSLKLCHVTVSLVITYEFARAGTTRMLNSIKLPMELASPLGYTSTYASRFTREFYVPETNPTLVQSAFRINFNSTGQVDGLNFRAGSQTFTQYTNTNAVVCGMFSLQQRVDSGATKGLGLSFARGKNSITIDGYSTDTTDKVSNINGVIYLNYTCDVPSGGVGEGNHSVEFLLAQWDALLTDTTTVDGFSISIPESYFFVNALGYIINSWVSGAVNGLSFDVQCLSTEGKGGGYYDIYTDAFQGDSERSNSITWMQGKDVFKRYPNDPDTSRLDVFQGRRYRWFTAATSAQGIKMLLTYHSISYTSTLTITGSSGGTVNVEVYRADRDEKILDTSRVGNGDVTLTWHDNTIDLYAVCYEGTANLGRSGNFKMGE